MTRRGAAATSLALLLAGGLLVACDGDDEAAATAPDPPASTPATEAADPRPPDPAAATAAWSAAVNELVEDPFYPDVGEPDVDALHYDLALRWDPADRPADRRRPPSTFRAPRALTTLQLDLATRWSPASVRLDGRRRRRTTHERTCWRSTASPSWRPNSVHTLRDRVRGQPGSRSRRRPPGPTSTASAGTRPRTAAPGPCRSRGARTPGTPSTTTRRTRPTTTSGSTPPPRSTASPAASWSPTGCTATAGSRASTSASRRRPTSPRSRSATTGWCRDRGPDGLPLDVLGASGGRAPAAAAVRESPELLGWLTGRLGPYPFPHAGVVLVPGISAMETQETGDHGRADPDRGWCPACCCTSTPTSGTETR